MARTLPSPRTTPLASLLQVALRVSRPPGPASSGINHSAGAFEEGRSVLLNVGRVFGFCCVCVFTFKKYLCSVKVSVLALFHRRGS